MCELGGRSFALCASATVAMMFRRIQDTAPGLDGWGSFALSEAKIAQKPMGRGSTPTAKSFAWSLCVQHRDRRGGQVRVRETHPDKSFSRCRIVLRWCDSLEKTFARRSACTRADGARAS
jgi:hypothetical protein